MAKYKVTHKCDHEEVHQLYGKETDRDKRISWFESVLCSDCWKKEKAEAYAKESAEAACEAKVLNLPSLTGSVKQIAWALSIRKTCVDRIAEGRLEVYSPDSEHATDADDVILTDAVNVMIDNLIQSHTEAKWWIDNRNTVDVKYPLIKITDVIEDQFPSLIPETWAKMETDSLAAIAASDAASEADEANRLAKIEAERQIQHAIYLEEKAKDDAVEVAAEDFVVSSVDLKTFRVYATDGRVGLICIDGGEWFVYDIDGKTLRTGRVSDRIGEDAKLWTKANLTKTGRPKKQKQEVAEAI